MIKYKGCVTCREVRAIEDFQKLSKNVDGYNRECKDCCNARSRSNYRRYGKRTVHREYAWRRVVES